MAMTLVSTVTVGSGGASSIEFTNIPQTGKDLLVLVSLRSSSAFTFDAVTVRLNGDTGSNYASNYLQGISTGSPSSGSTSGATSFGLNTWLTGTSITANTFSNGSIYISNYISTTNKSVSFDDVTEANSTDAAQTLSAGLYTTSSAITSLSLTKAFAQHSTASLYIIS